MERQRIFQQPGANLNLIIENREPVVIALQEPPNDTPAVMNMTLGQRYEWVTSIGRNFYHSVAIGISSELPYDVVDVDTKLPFIAIQITWPFPTTIDSCYIPPQPKMTEP